MNVYINYLDDETLYAILQALSPLCPDLKEEILHKLIVKIIDKIMDEGLYRFLLNYRIPDYL